MPRVEDINTLSEPEEGPSPMTAIQTIAEDRNEKRFKTAIDNNHKILSKYLPTIAAAFLPKPVLGPRDAFEAPLELLTAVAEIARLPSPTPAASPIHFDIKPYHLAANTKLLADADYNLSKLLSQHQHTTLGFGSEFRPIDQLRRVIGQHPHFSKLVDILVNGMPYRYSTEIT
jgi:hypothetical protein